MLYYYLMSWHFKFQHKARLDPRDFGPLILMSQGWQKLQNNFLCAMYRHPSSSSSNRLVLRPTHWSMSDGNVLNCSDDAAADTFQHMKRYLLRCCCRRLFYMRYSYSSSIRYLLKLLLHHGARLALFLKCFLSVMLFSTILSNCDLTIHWIKLSDWWMQRTMHAPILAFLGPKVIPAPKVAM